MVVIAAQQPSLRSKICSVVPLGNARKVVIANVIQVGILWFSDTLGALVASDF
jgi:hypothetical protein